MRKAFTGLLALTLVVLAGCSKQGTPGGPGATDTSARKSFFGKADDTFTLTVPTFSTSLQPGETKTVSIGINRARNFGEDVTLAFSDLPKGVTLEPASPVIKHGDTEAKFSIKVGDDAPVGDYKIKVTGHPTKGADATNEFALTVTKKDSFHLSVPLLSTTLKQGETKEITVGLKRDQKFDQDVTLTVADLPKGVTVEPASRVLKAGDTEAKYTLKAANDAAVGNFTLRFTGHPTVGADVSHEFRLTVVAKK